MSDTAAHPGRDRIRPTRVALLVGAAAAGVCFLLWSPPGSHRLWPACLFHRLTGYDCAGCGTTRAVYLLLHGSVGDALHHNALFVLGLPWIALWSVRSLRPWIRGGGLGSPGFTTRGVVLTMTLMGLFSIARNLPFAPCRWLATPPPAASFAPGAASPDAAGPRS